MNTKLTGDAAEDRVAHYLKDLGYKIIDRNWKTRWCEIDVVAIKNQKVYFVEVKYRKSNIYGDGFDAITSVKLKQMQFAAENWIQSNGWEGDYSLSAASVTGDEIEFVEI